MGLPEGPDGLPGGPGGRWTDGRMDGISPHSTGLRPLSEPLPKKDSIKHNHAQTTLNIVGTIPVQHFARRQQEIL